MSDSPTCPTCHTAVPAGAAFCTSCGARLDGGDASGSSDASDPTRVEDVGVHDPTRVQPAAPDAPSAWAPPAPSAPDAPSAWAPPAWTAPAPPAAPPAGPRFEPPAPGPWLPPTSGTTSDAGAGPWASPPGWGDPPSHDAPTAGAPGTAPPAAPPPRPVVTAVLGVASALLVLVSLLLAWVQRSDSHLALTGWDLATRRRSATYLTSKDPYLLLVLGLVALGVALVLLRGRLAALLRVALGALGVLVVAVLLKDYLDIRHVVRTTFPGTVTVTFQAGFWLGIVSGVLLVVAAGVPARRRQS